MNLIVIIAAGTVIAVISLFILSYAWKIPMEAFLKKKVNFQLTWQIYLKANLGKYLPGNVLHFVERNLFAFDLGLNQTRVALSTLLEVAVMIFTALLLSVVFGGRNILVLFQLMDKRVLIAVGIVCTVICITAVVCTKTKISSRLYAYWEKIKGVGISFGNLIVTALKMSGCYAIVLASNGLCFALICRFILEINLNTGDFIFLIICYILSWLAGYCMPGAPGGIGVREFILILLTKSIIGTDSIYLSVIIQRLISIIGDVLGYLISSAAYMQQKKRNKIL